MRSRLDSGLRDLNTEMISMGGLAEKAIRLADTALMEGDSKSAKEAMALQGEIRSKEKAIEQLCMKYLLLQAPMAQDLRTVSAALKMITDMSRICEIAGDMSEEILNMGGRIGIPGTQKMAEARGGKYIAQGRPDEVEKLPHVRGNDFQGMRIHSVRLPGFVASEEIIFGSTGETLTIRNDSINRECYMPGVMLGCRTMINRKGLVYGLDAIL